MEKETEIKHKRERERHSTEKTEKYQAHLIEATESLSEAARPS